MQILIQDVTLCLFSPVVQAHLRANTLTRAQWKAHRAAERAQRARLKREAEEHARREEERRREEQLKAVAKSSSLYLTLLSIYLSYMHIK